jgi:hypothetical protein
MRLNLNIQSNQKMNKYLKGCLVFLGIALLLVTGLVIWYYQWKANNQKQAQTDLEKFSRSCDTISLITEKPSVTLQNFDKAEIERLKFYLLRSGRIVSDTVIRYQTSTISNELYTGLPFEHFFKTDTIVVETQGNTRKYYLVSGFGYYASLHYGMMGYLGSYDCRFDNEDFLVNGRRTHGRLMKQDGLTRLVLQKK